MVVGKKVASHLKKLNTTDHRLIGAKQKLFFFHELSQGSCFWEPRGAYIYNKLVDYLRDHYKRRHYEEIITPNIYDCRLWETSGHWDHYANNMIKFKISERDFSLKPMNCPGHCVMFKNQGKLTSDKLPIRWADFGVLHRNELSGSLIGLTRVRRFQQDDAHIFCTPDQVEAEVAGCLDFANEVYGDFGFSFDVALSLRPEKYLGEPELWDKAENSLRAALDKAKLNWIEQKNEGAFYGPKIDMIVKDAHERSQQCATIQLDFQLPQRFDLVFKDIKTNETLRPVMIHRAILGSLERFIAMIAENHGGRWPFWLSPLQAIIIPVHEKFNDYARQLTDRLKELNFMVDCEVEFEQTLNAKIREAELTRYNYILVVGNKELENNSVTVRVYHEGKPRQLMMKVDDLIESFRRLRDDWSKSEAARAAIQRDGIKLDGICHDS